MPTSPQHAADFKKLPPEIQTSIVQLQEPGEDRFIFPARTSPLYIVLAAALIVWIGYVYTTTQTTLWESWMSWLILGISAVIFPVGAISLIKFVAPRLSKLKDGYIFTTNEFLKIKGNVIEFWSLREIDACRYKDHMNEVEVWIGEREILFRPRDEGDAEKLDNAFDRWKENAGEGLISVLSEPKYAFQRSGSLLAGTGVVVAAIAVGVLFSLLMERTNRNYDDDQTWSLAKTADSFQGYSDYKNRHPKGRYVADADETVTARLKKIKDDYLAGVKKGAAPEAVKTLASIYAAAADRPDRTIFVKISEAREIDPSVIPELESHFTFKLNSYESSVPTAGEQFRKQKVFNDLKIILMPPGTAGAFNFELSDAPPVDAPVIALNLLIRSEKLYYRITSFGEGRPDVDYYPGVSFNFKFDFIPSSSSGAYHTEYVGQPLAVSSGGAFDRRDKDNYTFDKVYFGTVMDDLDRALTGRFGFSEQTVPSISVN